VSTWLIAAMAVLCPLLQASEYVVLKNGVKLLVDRYEREGDNIWLYSQHGFEHVPAAEVERFEPLNPPPPPPAKPIPPPKEPPPPGTTERMLHDAAGKHGIPPELVAAVAHAESRNQQSAISPTGAIGVMQLTRATAAYLGANPHDKKQNIDGGVRYLRDLLLRYQEHPEQVAMALAAYNAGPGAVERFRDVPPYQETQSYVRKVIEHYMVLTEQ